MIYNRMYTDIVYYERMSKQTYTIRVYNKRILYKYTIKGGRAGGGANARICKVMWIKNDDDWW